MKFWDASAKEHLRKNKPSLFLYLVRGIGVFLIVAIVHPQSRFLGAIAFGIGFVFVDFIVYQIVAALHLRHLKKKRNR